MNKILKILIIDDDINVRTVIQEFIANDDYNKIILTDYRRNIINYLSSDFFIINANQSCDIPLLESLDILAQSLKTPINKLPVIILTDGYPLPYNPPLPSFEKPFEFDNFIATIIQQRYKYVQYKILPMTIYKPISSSKSPLFNFNN